MRSRLWRCRHLSHGVQWSLLLAVLVFFLFALPSFIKEPQTNPSRHQHTENIKERSPQSLAKPKSQAPARARRTTIYAEPAPENNALNTQTQPKAHTATDRGKEANQAPPEEQDKAPDTAQRAAWKSPEKEKTMVNTLSPRGQDTGMASGRAEAQSRKSQDTKTTQGNGGQTRKLTASRTVSVKHQGKAATTAKTLIPKSWHRMLAPTGAVSTRTRQKGVTTAVIPPTEKKAQATPPPAPFQSPTTQRNRRLKAANFKSEPRWDFEEKYSFETGGLQTTCPDSVKIKASKSLWLQKLFLANLTLFLDSRHFNQSEWDRLEHFAPPFGFMELNYSLVQKVVTRFPPVPQQQLLLASLPAGSLRCITCAVVGNGGILNNSHMGQEIDSHDYVFRLSGALIKGYEQDVGTRTSFYGFTAFSLTQSLLILGNRGFKNVPLGKDVRYLHFLEGTRDYEWLEALLMNQTVTSKNLFWFRHRPQEAFREALHMDRYLLLHPDFLRYMKNRFLRSKTLDGAHWRIYRPTTGALLLLTALHLCDQVSAYGFITEGHERFSDHYYDTSWKRLIFYINHDFKLEREVWKRLHDEGIIQLYQRPGPGTAKAKN
ncbi:alpha-N-acetylgalactosaminide alpha-2,6-sialyltransferase 1 isoform X1 [Symphalangus syndactylus]|uniref:alpha-N-acetylgalactosaminide alpha-2,6-sialyltransferase 1 isoform X1 n=1 Tax=Symphalangus syndactylus TaxID=9590 RepID=UPI0024430D5A|nr:alpha-N-acetylgalactosaminide alpha-2,6-sialyltransferase 1 isoform X1 [Symphalangus syndactylus]